MNRWQALIDEAAQKCGSQRALAEFLEIDEPWMSKARSGRQGLSKPKLVKLGELLSMDPGELWELQELALMPRRNPFRASLSAGVAAFFLVNMSGCVMPENQSATRTYELAAPAALIAHCRAFGCAIVRMARLMLRWLLPMHLAC